MGLMLFTLFEPDKLIGFPAADEYKGYVNNHLISDETINKELIIDIQAKIGIVPSTITKKISDIISEGNRN